MSYNAVLIFYIGFNKSCARRGQEIFVHDARSHARTGIRLAGLERNILGQ